MSSDIVSSAELIVFAGRWADWSVDRITETLDHIKSISNAEIVLFGTGVAFSQEIPTLIEKADNLNDPNALAIGVTRPERPHNAIIRTTADRNQVTYLSRYDLRCGEQVCPITDGETGQLLFYDNHHLSLAGANDLAKKIEACDKLGCKMIVASARGQ